MESQATWKLMASAWLPAPGGLGIGSVDVELRALPAPGFENLDLSHEMP